MPRLLNVNNYHYRRGGAETVYLGHGAMFAERGWDIDWFSMKHPLNPPGTDETYFADLIDLEHMAGKAAKAKAAAAIIYNRQAEQRIAALTAARRPDVAHLHNIYHHLSPSVLVALKKRGIPTVLTAHDLKLACPSYKMLSNGVVCERCKGGKVYRIVTPSQFYRDKLAEWGWDPKRIVYIPNFIAHDAGEPQAGGGDGPLLYFGRLSEEKGIATLIRAAALSGIAVRIAGTGPSETEFRALAETLAAPVEFMGYRSGAALDALIHDASAIVLPSEWYENGPMSVMEAYQAGRPVAGADIGGIPELVRRGETGWIFPSGDVAALAATMQAIVAAPLADRVEMGRIGGAWVAANFGAGLYADRMAGLYSGLMQ
jgi:glycosyltransferase involved in cell wall biosynthesis